MPRIKPPFPAVQGVYAAPTIVNNVETMSTVPHIINRGGEWYASMGVNRSTGTRIFSVSGNVERPGNYEVELGMTFRELIYDLAGGIKDGKGLGFFIPGGASSPWLIEEHLDAPLDMDSVQSELKTMLGSGAIMVFDETVDPLLVAWRIAKFFAHESCGKCTPCREGFGLAREGALPDVARLRPPRRSRPPARLRQQPRPGPLVAAGHDHDLPARAEHDVARP